MIKCKKYCAITIIMLIILIQYNVILASNTGINFKIEYNNIKNITTSGAKPSSPAINCKDVEEANWNRMTTIIEENDSSILSQEDLSELYVVNAGSEVLSSKENKEILLDLFDNKIPTTAAEMSKWLVTIQVPYLDKSGERKIRTLQVHKKLAQNYINALTEIADCGFKAYSLATYNFRKVNNGTNSNTLSQHSYGVAIDINPSENYFPGVTAGLYEPGKNEYSVTDEVISIMNKYGFRWGGNYKDYMHFSVSGR